MMKWHSELDIFRKLKSCIILEGNIYDQFHFSKDPSNVKDDLPSYLLKYLSDVGYEVISFFDERRGFYCDEDRDDISKLGDICRHLQNLKIEDDTIPCCFTNQMLGKILESVFNQAMTPTAVIMDMASRYIVSPDSMGIQEVNAFSGILRAIRQSQLVQINNECTKNILIMLVNKTNDLPAWFYLNNPDVKTIQVTYPDSQARMEFISGENLEAFFAPAIWQEDAPKAAEDFEQLRKLQKRFVGLTEGFSYSDLIGMRILCQNEGYHLSQLPKVVEFYRYGVIENKWAKVDKETVQGLENELKTKILGQEMATKKVMDVIKRSVIQKNGNNRPKGVLFFAGPTGTGKTETAKILAKMIFGDTNNCIRFDMSEYRQDQSDQKLLGAPPGYIGYEAGGLLTNAVKNNPFSILLFDEIEKAHPSILDKFLQILDDGRLTDGQGNTVYFSETIIIFTSNKGIIEEVPEYDDAGHPVFTKKQIVDPEKHSTTEVQQIVMNSIRNYFKYSLGRPELLNRIGDNNIVVFDFIRPGISEDGSDDVVRGILEIQINNCVENIRDDNGITVVIEKDTVNHLYGMAITPSVLENGGRGIRNLVEASLYTPLTRFIYDHQDEITQRSTIIVHNLQNEGHLVDLIAELRNDN